VVSYWPRDFRLRAVKSQGPCSIPQHRSRVRRARWGHGAWGNDRGSPLVKSGPLVALGDNTRPLVRSPINTPPP